MRVCITLDDVIRAKTRQFGKMLVKSGLKKEEELPLIDISTNDLCEVFGFKSRSEYNKFLYEDYAFEIFAEAPVMERMLDKKLNLWMLNLKEDEAFENIEFILANPYEFNASIGFTCFFLSQIATRVREFHFPSDSSDIWKICDVLITADPKLISEKPEGKRVIKINAPYNKDVRGDVEYDSLTELLNEENITEVFNG